MQRMSGNQELLDVYERILDHSSFPALSADSMKVPYACMKCHSQLRIPYILENPDSIVVNFTGDCDESQFQGPIL